MEDLKKKQYQLLRLNRRLLAAYKTKNIQSRQIDDNTIYLPVLKCASSWMISVMDHFGAARTDVRTASKVIIVTRDPIERWFTGMCTYAYVRMTHNPIWSTDTHNPTTLLNNLIELTETISFLDLHTLPQYFYTQHLDLNNVLAFHIDNLHENMSRYLNITIAQDFHRNRREDVAYRNWVKPVIRKLQKHLGSKLDDLYEADYKYLKRLNYYS